MIGIQATKTCLTQPKFNVKISYRMLKKSGTKPIFKKEANMRPIILGEVLFDHFPDGKKILGGAPFNVAWHLQGLGMQPIFVSCVGNDTQGEDIQQYMRQWGMDTAYLTVDHSHSTGSVQVEMDYGQPSYKILPDQAYDNIKSDQTTNLLQSLTKSTIFYHGSLAARSKPVQQIIDTMNAHEKTQTFMDVNLRAPWWDKPQILKMIKQATWVKLNDEELFALYGQSHLKEAKEENDISSLAQSFVNENHLELLILTLGSRGALAFNQEDNLFIKAGQVKNFQDSVGAGDAFASVMILGLMQQWPIPVALERASAFAAKICAIQGATTDDISLYDQFKKEWNIA